jgi:hypothetical protein
MPEDCENFGLLPASSEARSNNLKLAEDGLRTILRRLQY